MSNPKDPKKRRIDELGQSERENEEGIKRSSEFWFDDGSIVLQAGNTQFRVHLGVLSINSAFFAGMRGLPQPESQPSVDGCPLVITHDDTAEDWEKILMAIYYPNELRKLPDDNLPAPTLISMLRLGKKYQFELIRDKALKKLKGHIPNSLRKWDFEFGPLQKDDRDSIRSKHISWIFHNEFDIINIALELGIYTILPSCYYLCIVDIPMEKIFDGYPREDGTIAHLSPEGKRAVLIGRDRIRCLTSRCMRKYAFEGPFPLEECDTPLVCPLAWLQFMRSLMELVENDLRCGLHEWEELMLEFDPEFCSHCMYNLKKNHEHSRAVFWQSLPETLGLSPWKELKDCVE